MGRCLAVRPHLRSWRCNNEAGTRWFCHQHRRWLLLRLGGLAGAVLLAWGINYTWGLFAPPTKVEGDQTALLQDIHKKVQQLQASSSELAKAVPVVDELEVTIKSILDEASKSPIAALLTLSSALESEAQKIIAASGWNNHEGKDFTLDQSIERLIELGQAPRVAAQTFKLFSVVRSKMGNSGNAVSDADILSAIDSGVTLLKSPICDPGRTKCRVPSRSSTLFRCGMYTGNR